MIRPDRLIRSGPRGDGSVNRGRFAPETEVSKRCAEERGEDSRAGAACRGESPTLPGISPWSRPQEPDLMSGPGTIASVPMRGRRSLGGVGTTSSGLRRSSQVGTSTAGGPLSTRSGHGAPDQLSVRMSRQFTESRKSGSVPVPAVPEWPFVGVGRGAWERISVEVRRNRVAGLPGGGWSGRVGSVRQIGRRTRCDEPTSIELHPASRQPADHGSRPRRATCEAVIPALQCMEMTAALHDPIPGRSPHRSSSPPPSPRFCPLSSRRMLARRRGPGG